MTYVPRSDLKLEVKLRDYLDEGHRILSVAGPTKSGKTVLIRSVAEDSVWLAGGNIRSLEDVWKTISDRVGAYQTETKERTESEIGTSQRGGEAELGVQAIVKARAQVDISSSKEHSSEKRQAFTRSRHEEDLGLERLLSVGRVLVVDDFHYIPQAVQRDLVRALKQPVFDGLRVIVAAVPHRAFDAVRVEKEMTGRLEHLHIPPWSEMDLAEISASGFKALNIIVDNHDQRIMALNSFGSPHLMQDVCLQFCKLKRVVEKYKQTVSLSGLRTEQWAAFFQARADALSHAAFRDLLHGPSHGFSSRQKELYGQVLQAIAQTGPEPELTARRVMTGLKGTLRNPPPSTEVSALLEKMSEFARQQAGTEMAFEYDAESETLFMSDPFFAFVLRWGDEDRIPRTFLPRRR